MAIRNRANIDYSRLALEYNTAGVGEFFKFDRPSTLMNLYKALKIRGLKEGVDYHVKIRGDHCIFQKLTYRVMK